MIAKDINGQASRTVAEHVYEQIKADLPGVAVLVARAGHRVGVIDTDIQSPGIHVLFQFADGVLDAEAAWKKAG